MFHKVRGKTNIAVFAAVAACCSGLSFAQSSDAEKAAELVARLGHEDFQIRENATGGLIEMGIPAKEVVEAATRSSDPEVRFRAQRILDALIVRQQAQMLAAFAKDINGEQGVSLPGWDRFQEIAGTSAASRDLFVQMHRAEWSLLHTVEKDPKKAAADFARRCGELQNALRYAREQITLGSVTALLFLAGDERMDVPDSTGAMLYSFCYQNAFKTAIEGGKHRDTLRTLLGHWVRTSEGAWTAYQSLMMAMRYNLKEGLNPARKMLAEGANTPQHYKQYALLAIAKLGTVENVPNLERSLSDKTVCSRQTVRNGNNRSEYQTQIRDVALVATIHLHGKNPKDFGFERATPNSQYLYSTSTLGFQKEEEREAAFKKWQEHLASLKPKKDAQPDSNDDSKS
jgi:hypothetical protein